MMVVFHKDSSDRVGVAGPVRRWGFSRMGYIDVDTHIVECDATWDHFDPSERQYRPTKLVAPTPDGIERLPREMYLIGETLCRRFPTDCRGEGIGVEYSADVSHLENPAERLKLMDGYGVDVQLVISTNFIAAEVEHPAAEAAVARSWNRWMAERTADTGGRLRWALIPPTLTPERSFEELEFGAANGAAGIMIKGVEHGFYLDNPYFFPLYERAQDLDLTMVVHLGAAREHVEGLGLTTFAPSAGSGGQYLHTLLSGFRAVLGGNLAARFPRLRWAFVESGATWLPMVFHSYQRGTASRIPDSYIMTDQGPSRMIPHIDAAELMERHNLYVSCEADEDVNYLTSYAGDGHIMIGTDMCHNDVGSDPLAHTVLRSRPDVSEALGLKITDSNARRAFAIPTDFTPTVPVPSVAEPIPV
jgi:predicted TIM-barrel fold metal-dependent hydrolase